MCPFFSKTILVLQSSFSCNSTSPGQRHHPLRPCLCTGGEFDLLLAENGLFKARTLALGQHPHPTVADNPGGSLLWPLRGWTSLKTGKSHSAFHGSPLELPEPSTIDGAPLLGTSGGFLTSSPPAGGACPWPVQGPLAASSAAIPAG